jgi:hypothetical protein
MQELSEKEIRKLAEDVFNNTEDEFSIERNEWEENGEKFSAYTFKNGKSVFTTGEGGI